MEDNWFLSSLELRTKAACETSVVCSCISSNSPFFGHNLVSLEVTNVLSKMISESSEEYVGNFFRWLSLISLVDCCICCRGICYRWKFLSSSSARSLTTLTFFAKFFPKTYLRNLFASRRSISFQQLINFQSRVKLCIGSWSWRFENRIKFWLEYGFGAKIQKYSKHEFHLLITPNLFQNAFCQIKNCQFMATK